MPWAERVRFIFSHDVFIHDKDGPGVPMSVQKGSFKSRKCVLFGAGIAFQSGSCFFKPQYCPPTPTPSRACTCKLTGLRAPGAAVQMLNPVSPGRDPDVRIPPLCIVCKGGPGVLEGSGTYRAETMKTLVLQYDIGKFQKRGREVKGRREPRGQVLHQTTFFPRRSGSWSRVLSACVCFSHHHSRGGPSG